MTIQHLDALILTVCVFIIGSTKPAFAEQLIDNINVHLEDSILTLSGQITQKERNQVRHSNINFVVIGEFADDNIFDGQPRLFPQLRDVSLAGISSKRAKYLKDLADNYPKVEQVLLESVPFVKAPISNEELSQLNRLHEVKYLWFLAPIQDWELLSHSIPPKVKELVFRGIDMPTRDVPMKLDSVSSLKLNNLKVPANFLGNLKLQNLSKLESNHADLETGALSQASKFPHLTYLNLGQSIFDSSEFQSIGDCANLTAINLEYTEIRNANDKMYDSLLNCKKLKNIYVSVKTPKETIERFKKHLPECNFKYSNLFPGIHIGPVKKLIPERRPTLHPVLYTIA